MTTKSPSQVAPAPESSLEKIAYASVAGVPCAEPHDQDRLGYGVWLWLKLHRDPLEVIIHNAGARLLVTEEEAIKRIRARLGELGIGVE